MKRVKEKILDMTHDKDLYIFTLITLVFFGIFLCMQYALDTYSVFTEGAKNITIHFASCGRFITALFTSLTLGILKLNEYIVYYISYGLAIICTILSLYKFNKIIKEDIKQNAISILISTLVIINPFSIELYIYIEKGIMVLSILLCVLAFEQINKYFKDKNTKHIIMPMILMFLANCCYQGTIGIFVVISLIYILKYSKNIKDFIKNNIIVALTYGIPTVLNFIMIKLFFSNARVSGEIIFSESISKVFSGILRIFHDSYGLMPEYLFFIIIVILSLFIIYKIFLGEKNNKEKIYGVLELIYIIGVTVLVTVVPQLCQSTSSIWFVPRSSYSIASLIGILLLYLFINYEVKNGQKILLKIVFYILLIIQVITFIKFSIDGFIVNYEDKQNALRIVEIIKDYESKTGTNVDKIAFYNDKLISYTYKNIEVSGDMNTKAFANEWSALALIKYYSNKQFQTVEKDKEIELSFKEKNWENFSEEQIIIKDGIIHICNY